MRVLKTLAVAAACALLAITLQRLAATGPPDRPVPFNAPEPRPIHGNLVQNIGTIRVPPNTILHWACPECGPPTRYWAGSTFQVFNDQTDPTLLLSGINALGQRSGQEVLNGGTYHDVYVETGTGGWSLSFTREPVRR